MYKIIRRHGSVLAGALAYSLMFLIAVFGIRYYFDFDYWGYFWPWVSLVSAALIALVVLTKFSVWYRDYLIISDKRIVYHHQRGLLNKVVIESLYSDVVEVSYNQRGFSASLYGRGDLKIKTGGGVINFKNVRKPREMVELINNQREKYLNG